MIASANSLHDPHRRSFPGPAMVREPTGVRLDANPAPPGPESGPNRAVGGNDDDELRRLGERIAELAARINSAEARMMTLIAEFDRRGGWKDGGYSSCAEWLAWRIGTKIGTARERVRTARALERLPQTADALKHGTISYAKVRALTRVATPERGAELLEFARAGSAAKLERTVRMWKKRNSRGTSPGRKSANYLQGCTICVSCRWTGHYWTVPRKRENRILMAGLPKQCGLPFVGGSTGCPGFLSISLSNKMCASVPVPSRSLPDYHDGEGTSAKSEPRFLAWERVYPRRCSGCCGG